MAVNEPSPRAKPEDKVCLRCHKSLAPCYNCYISHLIGPDSGVRDQSIVRPGKLNSLFIVTAHMEF